MAEKKVMLTQEGYDELVKKLDYLKSVRRIEVADRLKAAIALGDLSENSEYTDAKNEQAFLEGEIVDLENKIRNADIIQKSTAKSNDMVSYGTRVSVTSLEGVCTYTFFESTKKGLHIIVHEQEKNLDRKYTLDKDMVDRIRKDADEKNKKLEDDLKKKSSPSREDVERVARETKDNRERPEFKHWKIGNELVNKRVDEVVRISDRELGINSSYRINEIIEVVTLGSTVRIKFPEDIQNPYKDSDKNYDAKTDTYQYTIVGTTEADPDNGKISDESPLGDALLGQAANSIVQVYAPRGVVQYTLSEIV